MLDLDVHASAIAAGDTRAFARWVAGAELSLRADLRRFAAIVDVETVLQEALLRTWQIAPRFTPDGEPNGLLRLSRRIARNLAVDLARRHRTSSQEIEAILEAPPSPAAPQPPDPFLRATLLECKHALPKKLGAALDARIAAAGGESDSELAAQLKMRLNTFLQNVSRARRQIAQCLRRAGIDLERELA
ncbi:MAG TPA: hypothetical protein VM686_16010 [Polyangiaceae bacterium]|nr:hypothetical protein [Polyangiaceae bacterium]